MSRIHLGNMVSRAAAALSALILACLLASCAKLDLSPDQLPLTKDTMMLLGKKGMDPQSPIFIRVFKEESELEIWKQRTDGRFYHLKTYPICNWSGDLGPKVKYGDRQAPEGFYTVSRSQMNPNSNYHLALNLGYPNAYDKSLQRTGEFLMIHGNCKSAGCYAMTDALIEEIYGIARESFAGNNDSFQVHAFPFRMTAENMARHANHEAYPFWRTLKEGYDYFELTRQVPTVAVCNRRYVVNVAWPGGEMSRLDPEGACPAFYRPRPDPFRPRTGEELAVFQRVVVPGPKMRDVASIEQDSQRSGLTSSQTTSSIGGFLRSGTPSNMSFAPAQ